ncbi:MAG TPA: VOC family protein [Anaeromyxobacteraceae bacterium]|nr:VOC family protein [Anaeromyxobacteraceae bacterium]
MTKPIPEGYHAVTPYLICRGAARAIQFYADALGAKELFRMEGPGGTIAHAELLIGDSHVMLADENAEFRSPQSVGGTPVSMVLYVEDVDATFARALAAGARAMREVKDQFYGDRSGTLVDPFGHVWYVSTHVEDVPPDEMERRMAQLPHSAP